MIKPILFNTDMVRAIQNDTKTVTRRVVKEPYYIDESVLSLKSGLALHRGTAMTDGMPYADQPYLPGEILYVRETFCLNNFGYHYRADWPDDNCPDMSVNDKWRPSIHMPREAARIFLRVTDVRVEKLQAPFFIHSAAIFALQEEGVDIGDHCRGCISFYGCPCCIDEESECGELDYVRDKFAELWDSTLKPTDRALYGWDANPWVWVIEFERCEKPEGA